jgi:hypothetical protein
MANTYVKIASVSVGVLGAASIDFTSIPATYTDLLIKVSARCDQAGSVGDDIYMQFNNDAGGNYSFKKLFGNGSTAGSNSGTSFRNNARVGRYTALSATASTFASNDIYIPNYAGSTQKSISADGSEENNSTTAVSVLDASIWTGTAAISSFKIFPLVTANFVQYSTATLYGIKKN